MEQDKKRPDHLSEEILIWREKSHLARTLLKGTAGMKEAANDYLPQHTVESDKSYARRLSLSTLLNIYKKTSSFLTGKVFQKDIVFADDVPESAIEWSKAINSKGDSLGLFAQTNFFNGISKGASFVFIDMPKKPGNVKSKKDEKAAGLRPYFKEIKWKDIRGGVVDDKGKLIQVRFAETAMVPDGEYSNIVKNRIRVVEIGKWKLLELDERTKEFKEIESGENELTVLNFIAFIPDEELGPLTGIPPMNDLGELNLKHWRSSSVRDNYLSVARIPVYLALKIDLEKAPMGVANMFGSDEDGADMKVVEHSGQAIGAGANDLKAIENNMALDGLQQLVPRAGNQTATEKSLNNSDSNSNLGTWATEYEAFMIKAFKIAAMFMKQEFPDNGLTVNKSFNLGVYDINELNFLISSKDGDRPVLSPKAVFDELVRKGAISDKIDFEDVKAEIEQDKRTASEFMALAGAIGSA